MDVVKKALASGEWVEKLDPKTKKPYYYNTKTKKTTWDLAKELSAAAPVEDKKEKKDHDAKKGSKADVKASAAATTPAAAVPAAGSAQALTLEAVLAAGEWVEKKDPKTGKPYYYNKQTKKTTWDLVKELGLSEAKQPEVAPEATANAQKPAEAAASPSQAKKKRSFGREDGAGQWRMEGAARLPGQQVLLQPRDKGIHW